ncbi:helix-turn-helix transcriptional regulator [Streptomyces sp. NPDC008061]|uniref:helix-turn-helix transcriptional regulator n=1 Tax=Streptomyces sp. NPDC008061 TaxID=3364805 RepID=UPI0036E506D7
MVGPGAVHVHRDPGVGEALDVVEVESGGALADAFHRFHTAVERDHAVTRRVEDHTAALGYSPRTLTRATLAVTGRTAEQYVDDRVLLEAKRLLQHSGLTAKEVTVRLGFTDASDFTKFFRLRTGMTPGAFREGPGPRGC